MRGKITAKATKPMDQEYELSVTLTLSDWRLLRSQISTEKLSHYPAFHLIDAINEIVGHAEDHFTKEIKLE